MNKLLLLVLLAFNGFAQVFYKDTSFVSERVKLRYGVQGALVQDLTCGLLLLKSDAQFLNDQQMQTANLLVDSDGKVIKSLADSNFPAFDLREGNSAITPDNKLLITRTFTSKSFDIIKVSAEGETDSTFQFSPVFIEDIVLKLIVLPDGNFVVVFAGTSSCRIFDKNGRFISGFDISSMTNLANARLLDMVYNQTNEYFLLVTDGNSNKTIVKTDGSFVIDRNFPDIRFTADESYISRLLKDTDGFRAYVSDYEGKGQMLLKYDGAGKKLWGAPFGKVSALTSNLRGFYRQNNGTTDIVYPDGKHIRIDKAGQVDSVFYNRILSDNISVLHVFPDGNYWIMRNKSGKIEKMDASGAIDAAFKITLETQNEYIPNQILRLPGSGNYLIDYYKYPYNDSPNFIRYSPYPNVVRIYNRQHKPVAEFFDSKTSWKTYRTKNSFVVRGDGKLFTIDAESRISVAKDTIGASDVVDWNNNYVYRKIRSDSIIRFIPGVGLDKKFVISGTRLGYMNILEDGRIAVLTSRIFNDYLMELYFNVYHSDGSIDSTFKTIALEKWKFFDYYTPLPMTMTMANGFLVNQTVVGEFANIARQRFLKFDRSGNVEGNYTMPEFRGGQFVKYQKDGGFFMNTASMIIDENNEVPHNFIKVDPAGKIDSTFTLLGTDAVYGFEFFDEDTMYAVTDKGLNRFIRQPLDKDEYFYMKPLPVKMRWNEAAPVKLNINTNIQGLQMKTEGVGKLENGYVQFEPKTGEVALSITDKKGRRLGAHTFVLTKAVPSFAYDVTAFYKSDAPFEFRVVSSSGLPVKITLNGKEYINSVTIDPGKEPRLQIKLQSDGNELYDMIATEMTLIKEIPLSTESGNAVVKYYPNPVSDKLIIEKNAALFDEIRLIGIDGKERIALVTEDADRYELSVRNLVQGMYLLVLKTRDRQLVYRIYKE